MIKNIILDNSQENLKFSIEVQAQILQLLYLQCYIFNENDFIDLVTECGGNLNYLEDPYSLTDALCKYYDREDTFNNCSYRNKMCEMKSASNNQSSFKFNILVVGKDQFYKSKFISTYTDKKLERLYEKSLCFTENIKEIKTENSSVILNVIEGPKLNEYSSLIADKLESVDACIFVYDRDTEDSFEAVQRFFKINKQLLTNIQCLLLGNNRDESFMKEDNVIKFCSKYNCVFYEFPFDKKDKIDSVFDTVIKNLQNKREKTGQDMNKRMNQYRSSNSSYVKQSDEQASSNEEEKQPHSKHQHNEKKMKNSKAQSGNTKRHKSIKDEPSVCGIDIKDEYGCDNGSKLILNQYDDQLDSNDDITMQQKIQANTKIKNKSKSKESKASKDQKHSNFDKNVPNEADDKELDQDCNKMLFNSQGLCIFFEYDKYLKSLKFFIDIDVAYAENSQHKDLIKIIYHQLNAIKNCKSLIITFCDFFNYPKSLGIESSLKYSDVEHELEEVTLIIDCDFNKNEEIKSKLLEYLKPTLECIYRLEVSELILKEFSSSLLANLLDNCSKYLQLVCLLRIEELRDKQLKLDLDGSWTENLKSLKCFSLYECGQLSEEQQKLMKDKVNSELIFLQ